MSKERFDHLLGLLRAKITRKTTVMREAISAEKRLVLTLRYLSHGLPQNSLCISFRVGRQTVSYIVKQVCTALHEVLAPTYLNAPLHENEWRHIAEDFEMLWDLPHCIGAIDGKHISMECPRNTGTNYHNYKGFFSMILLAVCDARYNFILYDVGQYGSTNDSAVLGHSNFGKCFNKRLFNYPAPEKIPGFPSKIPFFWLEMRYFLSRTG